VEGGTDVIVLVIVLAVTNLICLGVLLRERLYSSLPDEQDDPQVQSALAVMPPVVGAPSRDRRFISIEILNPIELAGTRGRMLGIAGSIAPGLTRRIVYDQTVKILRGQLVKQHVVADVRLHTLRPAGAQELVIPVEQVEPIRYEDEIERYADPPEDQPPV
jgi:hypothetical protein